MKCKKLITTILIITLLNSGNLFAPNLSKAEKERQELNKENMTRLDELMDAEFSESNLRELLILLDVPDPYIALKQAKIESGWFTSPLFRNHNSLFGMHFPKIRDSYAFEYTIADKGRRVSSYRSWQSSCLDYALLVKYYESLGYDSQNYYKFLSDINYCELGGKYIKLLKSMT